MKADRRIGGWAVSVVVSATVLLSGYPAIRLSAQGFPTKPPKPTPLSPARFPPFQEVALLNGLQLVIIEHHEQPVVSVTLSFRAGGSYDPAGKEGLSALVAELLTKGTERRTAEQLAATIEGVGGSLSASSGDDFLTVSADALSDQVDLVFDVLGDVARTRALSALALELSRPASLASRFFASEVYGRNPYGRSATRESYTAVTRDDVTGFAGQRLRPAGALLVVAGDVTAPQVQALVEQAFAGWRGAPPATASQAPAPGKRATDILLIHRPGSAQSNIVLGNTTMRPGEPIYYAGRIATQALGGGADARLFLILREQKGWTYGAYASLHRYRGLGYWQATAEVRTEVTDSALSEMLRQVDRIRTETIPDSELAAVKGFLVGSFPLTIETPSQIASQVANAKLLGLGDDYLRLYRERLSAVTALQARAAAARLYRRSELTVVVVGDAARIGARLQASSVMLQGKAVGYTVSDVRRSRDSLLYVERSSLASGTFEQRTTVLLDPADGSVRQVDQVTTQQGQKAETHLSYAGGRVKGQSAAPQQDGSIKRYDIDTVLPPGTVDENAVPFVVPALPLAAGKAFTLSFFTPSENAQKTLTFKVGAPERVTVAAGTFQAYRIAVTGSRVPFTMYVTTETPRRVVKTEFVGQPFIVELVK